jgi:response regulator NasT
VGDSYLVRRSLRTFIEGATDRGVCGEAENGKEAIEKIAKLKPDLVILDLLMPVMNGLDVAQQIARMAPDLPMLMFTMHASKVTTLVD